MRRLHEVGHAQQVVPWGLVWCVIRVMNETAQPRAWSPHAWPVMPPVEVQEHRQVPPPHLGLVVSEGGARVANCQGGAGHGAHVVPGQDLNMDCHFLKAVEADEMPLARLAVLTPVQDAVPAGREQHRCHVDQCGW